MQHQQSLVFYFFFQVCSIDNHISVQSVIERPTTHHLLKEVLDLKGIAGLNIALYTKPSNFNIQWLNFSVKVKLV